MPSLSPVETVSIPGLPAELVDMLVRETALDLAHRKLDDARSEVIAQKSRLEGKAGLLKGFSGKGSQERDLKTVLNHRAHYDSQIKKAESLTALLNRETGRWLECCLKTGTADYAVALSTHDFPADWVRFSYDFDLLVKSFQMGLQDLAAQFKRDNPGVPPSQLRKDSIRKLLPVSRQIEVDIEFFNRILAQQARLKKSGKATQHPEYSWCETTEQLAAQPSDAALATLHELLTACAGFLTTIGHYIKRERLLAEEKAAKTPQAAPSFLKIWWENAKPIAAQAVKEEQLEALLAETETLLMDGEFSARFTRYMVQTMTPSQPQDAPEKPAAHAATPAVQSDAELRALKARLQGELEEVAKIKAGLATRERTLRENEQALRDNEHRFAEKCQREQAALDEARAALAALEEEVAHKARQAAEKQAEELAQLEETKAELAARSVFIDESEQRLLFKGQEQLERLAELEQKEEELMTTKSELNTMRKEMGLPMIPLRAKPVDEFEE
ncbi:MAG: hypothetical protein ABW223_10260 [Rariglobus sp.]